MSVPFTVTETRNLVQHAYPSLKSFAEFQRANQHYGRVREDFCGVPDMNAACDLAAAGLPEVGLKVLDTSRTLAESAMRKVSAYDMDSVYGTSGAYVDMGRFVTGEPDCMIETVFDEVPVDRPVVTIVSNVNASGGIAKSDLERRGRLVVALIKAIETSGRSTELWVDSTNKSRGMDREHSYRISVLIKAASAPLDMGAVMYAFSHPSMLRALCFNAMHQLPMSLQRHYGVGQGYGCVPSEAIRAEESYGKGCVYLPAVRLGENAEQKVADVLKDLGISV